MQHLVRKIRSLARFCDHLAVDLLDPAQKQTFRDAARYFDDQAGLIQGEAEGRTPNQVG